MQIVDIRKDVNKLHDEVVCKGGVLVLSSEWREFR